MQVTLYFASYPPENYTKELRMFGFLYCFSQKMFGFSEKVPIFAA